MGPCHNNDVMVELTMPFDALMERETKQGMTILGLLLEMGIVLLSSPWRLGPEACLICQVLSLCSQQNTNTFVMLVAPV